MIVNIAFKGYDPTTVNAQDKSEAYTETYDDRVLNGQLGAKTESVSLTRSSPTI